MEYIKKVAILGGGPSGLFIFKRLVEANTSDIEIDVFEKNNLLGAGMPYSFEGANKEHITNVSGNEIPDLKLSVLNWLKKQSDDTLKTYNIEKEKISDYKVLPRLLFGKYLSDQFKLLKQEASEKKIKVNFHFNSVVTDIIDKPLLNKVLVEIGDEDKYEYDQIIVCTGHSWPKKYEGKVAGYFDSPYPPEKIKLKLNHPVALRGSSLTAIDAIRTLSRTNGRFISTSDGKLSYELNTDSHDFKMIMHSRNGLLPAVRFHLEDSHLSNDTALTIEEILAHRDQNGGFLSLDFLFEKNFKNLFTDKDDRFYQKIKDLNIEEFVQLVLDLREKIEPFKLFKAEFEEAEKSIKRKESVHWKELLAVLSFAMNKPAKYLSAEDSIRLQKVLMPLISIVIAFVPQSSVLEMLALYQAGVLDIVSVGEENNIEIEAAEGIIYHYKDENKDKHAYHYKTFIDCKGQAHFEFEDFPYKSLISDKTISRAKIKFKNSDEALRELNNGNNKVEKDQEGNYYLKVAGITINDHFQVVDDYGSFNERIFMMAVPYIGGFNPDYSGLDFCEAASKLIVAKIVGS